MENNIKFTDLPLSMEVLRAVEKMGFEEPTAIQAQAIPHLLEGRDLLGQAQTGTGKTCAFGIPLVEQTDADDGHVQHLILSPTRELAMQIADELHELARFKEGIRILAIYGGQPMDRQIMALKKRPQIIVGTPGRIMDHMRRRTLKFDGLKTLVLDEADEMLNMGFREDIDTILKDTPEGIQRVLFSATMPSQIMHLVNTYLDEPIQVRIERKASSVSSIDQSYIELRESSKTEVLCRLIEAERVSLALIFCGTKQGVDDLTEKMQTRGYAAEGLHGDMNQRQRTAVMNNFKQGRTEFLIATDVAARGIDVDDIEMVINYDIPGDVEYYVHRIGRTGRAGRSGKAVTFVVGREVLEIRRIQKMLKADIRPQAIPSISDVRETRLSGVISEATDRLKNEGDIEAFYTEALGNALEELNLTATDDEAYTMTDLAAAFLIGQLSGRSEFEEEIEAPIPYDEYLKNRRDSKKGGGRRSEGPSYGRSSFGREASFGKRRSDDRSGSQGSDKPWLKDRSEKKDWTDKPKSKDSFGAKDKDWYKKKDKDASAKKDWSPDKKDWSSDKKKKDWSKKKDGFKGGSDWSRDKAAARPKKAVQASWDKAPKRRDD